MPGSMPPGRAAHFVGLDALIAKEKDAAKGLDSVARAARDMGESIAKIAEASAPPTLSAATPDVSKVEAPGAPGATPGVDGGLFVSRMAAAVKIAEIPLANFAAYMSKSFDRVAGTTITAFRRIDSNSKFPTFDKAISTVKGGLGNAFLWGFGFAKKGGKDAEGSLKSLERAVKGLTEAFRGTGAQAGSAAQIVREMAGDTARAASSAGILARAWGNIKDLAPPKVVVPPAGQRAGRGRAIPLGARPAPVRRNAPPPPIAVRAVAGASAAVDKLTRGSGLLAQALESIYRRADDGFARITFRGTKFGQVLRALDKTFEPVNQFKVLIGFATGAARAVAGVGQALFRAQFFTSSLGDVAGKTFSQLYKGSGLFKTALGSSVGFAGKLAVTLGTLGTVNPFKKAAAEAGKLAPAMDKTKTATTSVTATVKGLGVEIATALGIFGVVYKLTSAVKDFIVSGVKGASDLAEANSAAAVTFGKFTGAVTSQADEMAKKYGLSVKDQMKVAAGFGEMAQGAGLSEKASARFANTMVKLSADFNSRNNFEGGLGEAAGKIQSALAGSAKTLREHGALIDEDTVKTYALAHGMAASADAIDAQTKFAARAAIIQEDLASSNGDLERTAGSAANQFRRAGGGLANFATSVGKILLPAVAGGTSAFNDLLASLVEVFDANLPMLEAWGNSAAAAMNFVGVAVRNAGDLWQIFQLKATEAASNTLSWIEVLPANFARFGEYLANNWVKLIADAMNRVVAIFQNAGTYIGEYLHAIWESISNPGSEFKPPKWEGFFAGFKAEADSLPEVIRPALMDVSKETDAIWAKIAAKEAGRKKLGIDPVKKMKSFPDDAADKDKKGPMFASLAEIGSKEAYSAIIKAQGGQRDGSSKETAKNTAKALELQKQIADGIKKLNTTGGLPIFAMP